LEEWHFGEMSNPCRRGNKDVKIDDDDDDDDIPCEVFQQLIRASVQHFPSQAKHENILAAVSCTICYASHHCITLIDAL
jgi:hypothetical protein